ncbi:MAG TPA: CBS domain-containing protein [Polyangiaceae bacterium]
MLAQDFMTAHVHTCSAEDTFEHAAKLMWENDIGCVVVTDVDRRPVGVITDRDIAMAAYTQGVRLSDGRVATAMSRHVVACSVRTPASEVEHLMQAAQIRRVPIVDASERLVGIATLGDLARATQATPLNLPAAPGIAKTLAAVSKPRMPSAAPRAA